MTLREMTVTSRNDGSCCREDSPGSEAVVLAKIVEKALKYLRENSNVAAAYELKEMMRTVLRTTRRSRDARDQDFTLEDTFVQQSNQTQANLFTAFILGLCILFDKTHRTRNHVAMLIFCQSTHTRICRSGAAL